MKPTLKLKNINISGIRGIRDPLRLPLNEKSILLYGDNGTGKSSISDSIEWFYTDKVIHLSSSEIDLKEALRNTYSTDEETSVIDLSYSRSSLDCQRKLFVKKGKLTSESTNATSDFRDYISDSENENLILRYQYLRDFIDQTKGDKLKYLSDIIGFSEVTKAKEVLKKAISSIKSEIKTQNFESQISIQKQTLIDKIGAAVSQEKNFLEKISEIIKPLNIGVDVQKLQDVDEVLNKLKNPQYAKIVSELQYLENVQEAITLLKQDASDISETYKKYWDEFNKIAEDVQAVMQTFLAEMLKSGETVISKKYHKEDTCPLCLQAKSLEELKKEIVLRLKAIEESSGLKANYDSAKRAITDLVNEKLNRINSISIEDSFADKDIKDSLNALKSTLTSILEAGMEKVTSGNKIPNSESLLLSQEDFNVLVHVAERINTIRSAINKDRSTELYANISAAKDAFIKIIRFENEKGKLEVQKNSLELIYNEFVKRQKEGLENFINSFSDYINELYQYMNPGEQFHSLRIAILGEEDELNGLTIEFEYNGKWISPPQLYFSESHLNCIGISFFLASVIAFNKVNAFLVLDDVISSFDTNHRQRFANLLFEKFSKYQVLLLTHEAEWFRYVQQLAKKSGWMIGEIRWSESKGTHLDPSPKELKEIIESGLANGIVDTLGNPVRKYLEAKLKEISSELEVKVSFRFNDINEKRMPDELLNELKSKISKRGGQDIKSKIPIIERVANSSLLGNLLSHDNPFNPKIGDLKAFWADILELESIFYCSSLDCTRPKVSLKNYDNVAKKIRCGCDATKYDWSK